MEHDQEGEALVVNNKQELIAATKLCLMQYGVPEQLVDAFCCMRFHEFHAWGITEAIIDGRREWCITQGMEGSQAVRIIAVFRFANTVVEPVENPRGCMPAVFVMPDKREIN